MSESAREKEREKCVSTLRTKIPAGTRDESFSVSCVAHFEVFQSCLDCAVISHTSCFSSLCHSCFASRSRLCTFVRIIRQKDEDTHRITEQLSCYVAGIARMRTTPRRNARTRTVHSIARLEQKTFL